MSKAARVGLLGLCLAAAGAAVTGCGGGGGTAAAGSGQLVALLTTSVPPATTGIAYAAKFDATFVNQGGVYQVVGGALPPGLKLNIESGDLTGYPRQTGAFHFEIGARDGVDLTLPPGRDENFAQDRKLYDLNVALGPPNILPQVVPTAQYRASYAYQIDVAGGTKPYTFTKVGGTLPNGVTVGATGLLGNFPTSSGGNPYSFQVKVTDANGQTDTDTLTMDVIVLPLIVLTSSLPEAAVAAPYDQQHAAGVERRRGAHHVVAAAAGRGRSPAVLHRHGAQRRRPPAQRAGLHGPHVDRLVHLHDRGQGRGAPGRDPAAHAEGQPGSRRHLDLPEPGLGTGPVHRDGHELPARRARDLQARRDPDHAGHDVRELQLAHVQGARAEAVGRLRRRRRDDQEPGRRHVHEVGRLRLPRDHDRVRDEGLLRERALEHRARGRRPERRREARPRPLRGGEHDRLQRRPDQHERGPHRPHEPGRRVAHVRLDHARQRQLLRRQDRGRERRRQARHRGAGPDRASASG